MWCPLNIEVEISDVVCNHTKFTLLVLPNPCTGQHDWFLYYLGKELRRGHKTSILDAVTTAERMAEQMGAVFN